MNDMENQNGNNWERPTIQNNFYGNIGQHDVINKAAVLPPRTPLSKYRELLPDKWKQKNIAHFDYPQPVAGEGHFISTYKHNGSPIPSFEGEPLRFACPRTIGDFAHDMWSSLNLDNKVSLFARVIDLDTGESGDMIFNKYDPVCSDFDDPEEPELLPEELELLKKLDAEEE